MKAQNLCGLHTQSLDVDEGLDPNFRFHPMQHTKESYQNVHCLYYITQGSYMNAQGAQWLSGRVLDSRPRGCGFEPHWRHCVVVLEQDAFILV